MPIQTEPLARKADKPCQKLLKTHQNPFFNTRNWNHPLSKGQKALTKTELIRNLNHSEGFLELDYDINPDEIQQKKDYFGFKIGYLQNDNLPPSEKIAKKSGRNPNILNSFPAFYIIFGCGHERQYECIKQDGGRLSCVGEVLPIKCKFL